MKSIKRYGFEGIVIIFGILFSFYVEELRVTSNKIETKNKLVQDLNQSLSSDLKQITSVKDILNNAQKLIVEILDDIDKDQSNLTEKEVLDKLIDIDIGTSFFPSNGLFIELISTGTFELIDNQELKSVLLEIFNHRSQRNLANNTEIDLFRKDYRFIIFKNFRTRFNYNSAEGEYYGALNVVNYEFNKDYYLSDEFYGYQSQAMSYAEAYLRFLNDYEDFYNRALTLSQEEIS
jgi:hypothetical protein|tara:strand:+ start:991 stop:1692 length:702 start_codon:yes stop_codon:yes gene_type:complete